MPKPIPVEQYKLGRTPRIPDGRDLLFASYVMPSLPPPPPSLDLSKGLKFGMLANNTVGDCTCAGMGHALQVAAHAAGNTFTPTTTAVLAAYYAMTGGEDTGLDLVTVLKYMQKTGLQGQKIGPYVSVKPTNETHLKQAFNLVKGGYLGVNLPLSAQKQKIWDVPVGGTKGDGEPGSWGPHCVDPAGYSPDGVLVVTWGKLIWCTWHFFFTYFDEVRAFISPLEIGTSGKSPDGFDYMALQADLKAVQA